MSGPWKLRGYVVERLLGAGASGEVWRARVAATGELVALKRLPPMDSRDSRRLHSEAAMLSALDHPNLIRLHAVVPDERVAGASVLVLDLAEGGSLAQLLTVRGRLSPGEVVTALAPIAAAVAYAHTQGVVHGDISAANVLFTAEGSALLADLGVARLVGDDHEAESTPAYVDPAVAVGCVPAPSSDVFMLGGVALHALTGSPPWPGTADMSLAAARIGALDDIDDRLAAAGVPEPVAGVVARALCPESFRRGTAADFALDLRAAAEPVAVELRAGRSREVLLRGARSAVANSRHCRPRGGRHAAAPPGSTRPPLPWRPVAAESAESAGSVESAQTVQPAEPAEPAEPKVSSARAPGQPPTRVVHARPRPQLPRPGRRRPAPRRLVLGGLAVLAAGLAVVLVLRPGGAGDAAAAEAPAFGPTLHPASVGNVQPSTAGATRRRAAVPTSGETPGSGAVGSEAAGSGTGGSGTAGSGTADSEAAGSGGPPSVGPASPGWAGALVALDRLRERAFATRRPALLRRVYADGRLRRADTALLIRLVPPGCGLRGVRTHYRQVRAIAVRGPTLRLRATASLRPSRLVCAGSRRATARGLPAIAVQVELRRTPDGLRIVGEQQFGRP